jgi:hypothetical protein
MASRKETPDVLGEILRGEPTAPSATPAAPAKPEPQAAPKRRAPAQRAKRPSKPKLQAWEVREVVFRDYGGYRPRYVNGEELDDWKNGPLIHDYLNQAGAEGWELAGVGSRENREMPVYLKRIKT